MQSREETLYADTNLEKKVLSHYMRFDSHIAVRIEYFTQKEARQLFLFAQKYRRLANDLDEWWDIWRPSVQRQKENVERAHKFLQLLWLEEQESEERIDYYLEQLKGFAEGRKLRSIYVASIELFDKGQVTEARELLRQELDSVQKEFGTEVISRADFMDDFVGRYRTYRKRQVGLDIEKIPTGITKLDRRIGGVPRASLSLIQGESGVGKTFILMELAYQAMLHKLKALFVTVELRKEVIETRWDGRMLGVDYERVGSGDLDKEEEIWWRKRIRDLGKVKRKGGRLATAFIPEGCTTMALESELDFWKEKWGTGVDVLIVDYADLMDSGRKSYSEQEKQGMIFRDLKRLCQIHDLVLWTATQLPGRSYGRRKVTLEDIGYSKRKANWSNLVIGIGGDVDDREEGILPLYIAKNNFGKSGFEIILYPDFARGFIDAGSKRHQSYYKRHGAKNTRLIG